MDKLAQRNLTIGIIVLLVLIAIGLLIFFLIKRIQANSKKSGAVMNNGPGRIIHSPAPKKTPTSPGLCCPTKSGAMCSNKNMSNCNSADNCKWTQNAKICPALVPSGRPPATPPATPPAKPPSQPGGRPPATPPATPGSFNVINAFKSVTATGTLAYEQYGTIALVEFAKAIGFKKESLDLTKMPTSTMGFVSYLSSFIISLGEYVYKNYQTIEKNWPKVVDNLVATIGCKSDTTQLIKEFTAIKDALKKLSKDDIFGDIALVKDCYDKMHDIGLTISTCYNILKKDKKENYKSPVSCNCGY